MTTLMQASHNWMTRPADQRFLSLDDLHTSTLAERERSIGAVASSKSLRVVSHADDLGLSVEHDTGVVEPTNWSFGQLAQLVKAPAGYLRTLHPALAADNINYGLQVVRDAEEVGVLRTDDELRAATGPRYGRVWNSDIVGMLHSRFGDGRTGDFRVPGEFGRDVPITHQNTTIYGSDRDIFVFLADEKNRIDVPNRRNGQPGSLARGFFVWNSEVGSQSIGAAFFLFDYVCMNRIVWGVEGFKEIRLRHTKTAPDRWLDEVTPVLAEYANAAAAPIEETIKLAQEKKVANDLDKFLKGRFTSSEITGLKRAHEDEEGRPVETVWDAVTGATAAAKRIEHQDRRVDLERRAGKLLDLV